jgi:hypothetical protein
VVERVARLRERGCGLATEGRSKNRGYLGR